MAMPHGEVCESGVHNMFGSMNCGEGGQGRHHREGTKELGWNPQGTAVNELSPQPACHWHSQRAVD